MTVKSTNERVLELFRELNCLAEIDSDAAFIVNTYRAGLGHVRPRHLGRREECDVEKIGDLPPSLDDAVEYIQRFPYWSKPKNPDYVKSHVNAPGTVRSWFRMMRAADFARDTALTALYGGGLVLRSELQARWTLFDTLQVVDRETKATYPPPFKPDFTFYIIAEHLFLPRGYRFTDIEA